MRWMGVAVCGLGLVGCAAHSGAALRIGPSTYQTMAKAPGTSGSAGARTLALDAANAKCAALGKTIKVSDISVGYAFPASATATVTFECD